MAMLQAFRNAPPGRQMILIALAASLLCALLAAVYFFWFRATYVPLYRDLREADAATVVAELEREHVPYRLADGGRTVLVPEGDADGARVRIAGQDLPLQGTAGFELFNGSSIGLTEFAQRINLQRALQGELARTIMRIEGVDSARVHLSMGEPSVFRGDRRPPRASVSVAMQPGRSIGGGTVRGIQRLVAGSVPELDLANVAVLNERGAVVSGEAPPDADAALASAEERSIQRFFETRIRRALETRYPADAVEVSVWAAVGENRPEGATPPIAAAETGNGRDFRLRVTVAVAAALSEAAQAEAIRAVHEAIGFDPALGDSVTVTASAPTLPGDAWNETADGSTPAPTAARTPAPEPEASFLSSLWMPLALIALVLLFVAALRRRRAPAPMSEPQRLAFTANLKALLSQRSADAAPQS
jgi:flagellar M-ring protein FliF